jgi:phenylacetate-CoA ligase
MYGPLYRHLLLPLFDGYIKGRKTLAYWKQAEEAQWWSPEQLARFQLLALKRLLQHAAATCPYYAETWRSRGLTPSSLAELNDFHQWPLIKRETIREHRLAMRTNLPIPRMAKATGGSSGVPLQFDLNADSNDRRTAMMYRGYGWAGGAPGSKQLMIWGTALGSTPTWKRWKTTLHQRFDRQLVLSCFDFTPEKMRQHQQRWNQYRPEVVIGYTNPLYEFAQFLDREQLTVRPPKSVIVGAEKLHEFQRERLEQVFHAPVFETYGSREFMLIGAECERHEGLHLSLDNLVVEVLDDEGRPCAPGEEGNVVITDLFNFGMPFIRYVNGDRAVAGWGACSCGRGLPLLKKVVGRQLDTLETPDGRKIPGEFFPHLLKEFPSIRRFQVRQERPSEIVLSLVTEGTMMLADRERLLSEIRRCAGTTVELILNFVNDIPLTQAGKHRVVVRTLPSTCENSDTEVTAEQSSRRGPIVPCGANSNGTEHKHFGTATLTGPIQGTRRTIEQRSSGQPEVCVSPEGRFE